MSKFTEYYENAVAKEKHEQEMRYHMDRAIENMLARKDVMIDQQIAMMIGGDTMRYRLCDDE